MSTLKNSTRGFTLIELLVVITIIGILATGATATYTSQIQKARDVTRINDIKALQSGIEQYYQDKSEYPAATDFGVGVIVYTTKIPADSKNGQPCNGGVACGYAYKVSDDNNGILNGAFEISTAFENKGNVDGKAATDDNGGGNKDSFRFEVGTRTDIGIDTSVTVVSGVTASSIKSACVEKNNTLLASNFSGAPSTVGDLIVTCN